MKASRIIVVLLALTALLSVTTCLEHTRVNMLKNQINSIIAARARLKDDLNSKKIDLLAEMTTVLEERVGNVSDLRTIERDYQPMVIQWRWSQSSGKPSIEWEDKFGKEIDVAIERILFTRELLADDKVSDSFPKFRDIVLCKTSKQIERAHEVAHKQIKEVLAPFRKREKDIMNDIWD